MTTYYIDYENVLSSGLEGVDKLSSTDEVLVFYSPKADTMRFAQVLQLLSAKAKLEFLLADTGTPNALDFQLVALLFSRLPQGGSHVVISKDRGYDAAIKMGMRLDLPEVRREPSIAAALGIEVAESPAPKSRRKGRKSAKSDQGASEGTVVETDVAAPGDAALAGNDTKDADAVAADAAIAAASLAAALNSVPVEGSAPAVSTASSAGQDALGGAADVEARDGAADATGDASVCEILASETPAGDAPASGAPAGEAFAGEASADPAPAQTAVAADSAEAQEAPKSKRRRRKRQSKASGQDASASAEQPRSSQVEDGAEGAQQADGAERASDADLADGADKQPADKDKQPADKDKQPADKPAKSNADRTATDAQIRWILESAGVEVDKARLAAVAKNAREAANRQLFYRSLVKKFGQQEGLSLYNQVKPLYDSLKAVFE